MASVKTDNSFLADKIALRANHLPNANEIRVLDCFAGNQKIWSGVAAVVVKKILTLPIDLKKDLGFALYGNNTRFLESLDLDKFDAIDLDAYGVPFDQLEIIARKKYRGWIYATFIGVVIGAQPNGMLEKIGFTPAMIKKSPALIYRRGWLNVAEYLASIGVGELWHRQHERKHYVAFRLG